MTITKIVVLIVMLSPVVVAKNKKEVVWPVHNYPQ
jgi:hypothetical protein